MELKLSYHSAGIQAMFRTERGQPRLRATSPEIVGVDLSDGFRFEPLPLVKLVFGLIVIERCLVYIFDKIPH